MRFVALDFETANADLSSICQIGAVAFDDGVPSKTFTTLVNPDDYFDAVNVGIHGIDEDRVRDAPKLPAVYDQLATLLQNEVVVSHTAFDRAALKQAEGRHSLKSIVCQWLDTTMVVRRTWPQFAHKGYGLDNLAREFGIEFRHHDAVEDARVTGLILMRALCELKVTLDACLERVKLPINLADAEPIRRAGNVEGSYFGQVAVFTGALSIPRRKAADMASAIGCRVDSGVTKETTLLIVGDQDVTRLAAGATRSSKQMKAVALIGKGQDIRILRESDFVALCLSQPTNDLWKAQ